MTAAVASALLRGIRADLVTIEVQVRNGLPGTSVIGLPDSVVRESRERVRAAIEASGFRYPTRKVLVNLAPAGLRKEGDALDLGIAIGVLAAGGALPVERLAGILFLGELSLDGTLRPVRGVLASALAAAERGFTRAILPTASAPEAAVVDGIAAIPAANLQTAARIAAGEEEALPVAFDPEWLRADAPGDGLDLADVAGHEAAKRALVVAAAGGHNLLLFGPPGSGKTLLARRLPSILPPPSLAEAIEITQVHGALRPPDRPLVARRPFRAPHHSISSVGLLGGGPRLRPGEVTLAHRGVLFLDELLEFRRDALEALRQPIEDGRVVIGRARGFVELPADLSLVAASNPCPCGYRGDPDRFCSCLPSDLRRYRAHLSGPLLDRFDLHCEMRSIAAETRHERRGRITSAEARARVSRARQAQERRYRGLPFSSNARVPPSALDDLVVLGDAARRTLTSAATALRLSSRSLDRCVRVARTIADLDGESAILEKHVAEALAHRPLDRAGRGGEVG